MRGSELLAAVSAEVLLPPNPDLRVVRLRARQLVAEVRILEWQQRHQTTAIPWGFQLDPPSPGDRFIPPSLPPGV